MMGFDLSLLLRFTLFILLFFCKIQFIVSKSASPGEIAIDKEALIYLKSQISMDVSNSLSYWNPDSSPCNWTGVFCDGFGQRVEGLDLSGLQLKGSISPYIGNLTSLRSLQLQNNQLTGNLPQQLGNLARLQLLNASFNSITGVIPGNISHCKGLRTLDLMQNEISGGIPEEISQFRELQILNLARNHLSAKVGDFGLAQLLMKSKDDEQPPTSSTCTLKGSIGYIPPEYGAGMKPSPAGDVYSFGITLLQLFTGRSPRDESFSEGLSLKKWVEMKYQAKMQEPELVLNHQELLPLDEMRNDCLVDEIIQVGLSCAADCPEERLAMKDALHKLECVKVRLMTKPKELSRGN